MKNGHRDSMKDFLDELYPLLARYDVEIWQVIDGISIQAPSWEIEFSSSIDKYKLDEFRQKLL